MTNYTGETNPIVRDETVIVFGGIGQGFTRNVAITRRPAEPDMLSAWMAFYQKTTLPAHAIIVGWETYMNYCCDVSDRHGVFGTTLRPSKFKGSIIVVDHDLAWGARCTYNPRWSWPSYLKDEEKTDWDKYTKDLKDGDETTPEPDVD